MSWSRSPDSRLRGAEASALVENLEDGAVEKRGAVGALHRPATLPDVSRAAVAMHDAVLDQKWLIALDRLADGLLDVCAVVRMDDARERSLGVVDEVGGRVPGDLLDLIADEVRAPVVAGCAAVDRSGEVLDQGSQPGSVPVVVPAVREVFAADRHHRLNNAVVVGEGHDVDAVGDAVGSVVDELVSMAVEAGLIVGA